MKKLFFITTILLPIVVFFTTPSVVLAVGDEFFQSVFGTSTVTATSIQPGQGTGTFIVTFEGTIKVAHVGDTNFDPELENLEQAYAYVQDDANNPQRGFYIGYTPYSNNVDWSQAHKVFVTGDLHTGPGGDLNITDAVNPYSEPTVQLTPGQYVARLMVEEDWDLFDNEETQLMGPVVFSITDDGTLSFNDGNGNSTTVQLTTTGNSNTGSCPDGEYCVLAPLPNFSQVIDGSFKLGDYAKLIFRIGIGLAALLSVLMIVIGGMRWMISDVVGDKEGGKEMIRNAIGGLILILGAWAVLNTINPDILSLRFLMGGVGGGGSNNGGGQNNQGGGVGDNSAYTGVAPGGEITMSCSNDYPGTPACSSTNNCGQYVDEINAVTSDATMRKVLKSLMVVESSCQINAGSPAGACGLFQILPSTADLYKAGCTNESSISCEWLKTPANVQASACIAKNYLTALRAQSNTEGEWRNVFAGYNGSQAGLTTSSNCQNETSCLNGEEVKQWECPWNDDAHTVENTGFLETRNYVRKLSYCLLHPEPWTGESSFDPGP